MHQRVTSIYQYTAARDQHAAARDQHAAARDQHAAARDQHAAGIRAYQQQRTYSIYCKCIGLVHRINSYGPTVYTVYAFSRVSTATDL